MKSALAALVLVAFYFTVATASTLAIANCNEPGVKDESTSIYCQIINGKPTGEIIWHKPDSNDLDRDVGSEIIAMCNVENLTCSTLEAYSSMYTAVAHTVTEYSLTINAFTPEEDYGYWTCRDSPHGYSSPCKKLLASKLPEPSADKAENGTTVHVVSTYVLILWIGAMLATNMQTMTSTFFN